MSLFGRIKKGFKTVKKIGKGVMKFAKPMLSMADKFATGGLGKLAGKVVTGVMQKGAAKKNRGFQREMSNTAFQRRTEDMRSAGINPLYDLGGASTPGGATAQVPEFGDAADTAITAKTTKSQRALMESHLKLATANASNVDAGTAKIYQQMEIDKIAALKGRVGGDIGEAALQGINQVLQLLDAEPNSGWRSKKVQQLMEGMKKQTEKGRRGLKHLGSFNDGTVQYRRTRNKNK